MRNSVFFLFLICFIQLASAETSANSHLPVSRWTFFHQLNSSLLEIIEEGNPYFDEELGDYPFLARIVQKDIFKRDPTGEPGRFSSKCNPWQWQKETLNQSLSDEQLPEKLSHFIQTCESEWTTNWTDVLTNTLGMVSFKLHPNRYPYGRHVILHLPNKIKVKGLLAMKTDGKKRPLIIFRTGIFSNTQEFYPERFLFFQMFEQSPFNILVLESSSGSEFLKHNDSFSLGGFDEGVQNFWIAQNLQSPNEPISRLIENVHMMGLSMGGHGVLFSALLNQYNPAPGLKNKPVIQSAMAFCPLMNMQETLDYHRSQGFTMDLMNYYASRRLTVLQEKLPQIQNENFIPDFFQWIKDNYKGPLIAENGKVPGLKFPDEIEKILNEKDKPENLFWKLNQYWRWFHNVKTPVMVYSTRRDPIVSWFINAGRVEEGQMNLQDSNIRFFTFEQGFHCSLPIAYDWSALTTLFQTYFLKMSPDFQMEVREFRTPLNPEILKAFEGQKAFLDLEFEVPENAAGVFATIRFDRDEKPSLFEKFWAYEMKAQLPLSEMEYPIEKVVRNQDESSLLRRWAYQNIQAHIDGSDLVFTWKVTK